MPMGPGKYDFLCGIVRNAAQAQGTVLIILNGQIGSGFSVQGTEEVVSSLPKMLREVADEIEQSLQAGQPGGGNSGPGGAQ